MSEESIVTIIIALIGSAIVPSLINRFKPKVELDAVNIQNAIQLSQENEAKYKSLSERFEKLELRYDRLLEENERLEEENVLLKRENQEYQKKVTELENRVKKLEDELKGGT